MNVDFTVYRLSDGLILRHASSPPSMVDINCREGEEFYLGHATGCNYIKDNMPVFVTTNETIDKLLDNIKIERSARLRLSDWTQLPDVTLTILKKTEWAAYRQALRDFPDTCDPTNPVWPVPPI